MRTLFNVIKFIGFTVVGMVTKKTWDWLVKDVDPVAGTQEFSIVYRETQQKLERLKKKHDEYRKNKE